MNTIKKSVEIGGRTLTLETGGFAFQADAAVLARYGDTEVLATVCTGASKEDLGFLPLDVEYVERLYAGGRIKGSRWVKREGRPSDEAVLTGRLVDRSIRPLFPKNYFNEVQVTVTVLSVDLENDPDVLSIIAASAALSLSSIPWNGPVGSVRMGLKEEAFLLNPTNAEKDFSDLDMIVTATAQKVEMIEAGAKEVAEEKFLAATEVAFNEAQKIINLIADFAKEAGKEKQALSVKETPKEILAKVEKEIKKNEKVIFGHPGDVNEIKEAILADFLEEEKKVASKIFDDVFKKMVREKILTKGERIDGRKIDEIRPIAAAVGLLPRTHGSALFSRGDTQVLTVATLGSPSLEQLFESAEGETSKRFMHHYNMPPYSMGEVGKMIGPGRREIGHGALAERALEAVIPAEDKFPYTIRLVSEVLSSNGSTSMASTCGSTLALMDAGVPIKEPVAGIAMGLVTDKDESRFVILTDICGLEDFNGDMDFKIAGTKNGITAVQLDVKIPGLTLSMIKEILERGKTARLVILEKMLSVLPAFREKLSQYAPRVVIVHIDPEKIGEIIGPGGKMIRKIISESGATVDVEDDGSVNIFGFDENSVAKAAEMVNGLIHEVKPGEIYEGTVKRIQPFGAFVEILPGKEGLVHVSQMAEGFVSDPSSIVSLGQKVKVKVLEIDELKRINLSMLLDINKPREPRPQRFSPPRRPFKPRRPSEW